MTPEAIGIPAFIILTGFSAYHVLLMSGKIRLGREYEDMKTDRDWWRSRAERGVQMAEKATSVADRLIPPGGS